MDIDVVGEEIRLLEERLLDPQVRASADALSDLLAESFVEFGSSGRVFSREAVIGMLGRERNLHFEISDFKLIPLAADLALATYRASKHVEPGQQTVRSLRSTIWQRREGRWRALFHQGTLAAEAAPT